MRYWYIQLRIYLVELMLTPSKRWPSQNYRHWRGVQELRLTQRRVLLSFAQTSSPSRYMIFPSSQAPPTKPWQIQTDTILQRKSQSCHPNLLRRRYRGMERRSWKSRRRAIAHQNQYQLTWSAVVARGFRNWWRVQHCLHRDYWRIHIQWA